MFEKTNKIKNNTFITIDLPSEVMFDNRSPWLSFHYWNRVLSESDKNKSDKFGSFEHALNYIETFSDYSLFDIANGKDLNRNTHILLIYTHK